ncbi:HAD-IC family P-type ATPase [Puniceicoccales bacterium CK1056]|uniref:HAD-IC family P-type ATPase n=1 Tax=Oceanipulchritudo coccoides TaxID=2706888 RepID=A0A6B2LXW5_9BACT|nr:HAD-IC family P-type ATPase [Oceanipulchritudo coccoides]
MNAQSYKTCIHCGTPFSVAGRRDSEFCCNGCEYVSNLIRKEGFDHYYDLRDRRIAPVAPAAMQPRDYSWLETRAADCEKASPKLAEMVLDLEGISCVGCVWLIEKIFRQHPGSVRIEINTQYGQVRLQWRPGVFRLVDFAREIQQFGYLFGPPGKRPQDESKRLLGRVGVCGAFALNAMLFTLPRYLGMDPEFSLAPLFELLSLLFATLSLLAGGSYFIKRGFLGLMQGVLHIDFPIAVGVLVAWAGSILGWLIADTRFLYFDFVAIFIFLMLAGRWAQERTLERNRHRLLSQNKAPREVHVVNEDLSGEEIKSLDLLKAGERIRTLPGEVVPVLCELESNKAALSLEWINGESAMRTMKQGHWVPSGAQNIGMEPILLKARQSYADSLLSRLLSSQASEQRNPLMEKILRSYIGIVLLLAIVGALLWALVGDEPLTGLQVALSILVVSCPCALGVAYPLAQEWAVLHLRPFGIFVRSAELFGKLGQIRQIVFDKTGTLTLEAPELENPERLERLGSQDRAILREMVKSSLHPVSRALREAFLNLPAEEATVPEDLKTAEEVGMGLLGKSETTGKTWSLGRPGWKTDQAGPASLPDVGCEFRLNGKLVASFSFKEALREDAIESVKALRARCPITILSGDRVDKVRAMARQLNLPESAAIGEQTPDEKAAFMESIGDAKALYVGDGANDALAFSKAAVRGTPATPHGLLQDKADFYFTGRSLSGLLHLFRIQRLRKRAIQMAFVFAVSYNVIVVAVALAARMHPLLAAILMPLSSLATLSIVALVYRKNSGKLQA